MIWLAAGLMAASAGTSMLSSFIGSREQQAIAKYNAKVARMQAEQEAMAIEANSRIMLEESRKELSAGIANLSNRGVDITQGSPLLVMTERFSEITADANEMIRQANIARAGGQARATAFERQAEAEKKALPINLLAAGLGGASNVTSLFV